MEELQAVVAKI